MIPTESPEASLEFIQELRKALREVRFDRMSRLLYSTDASIYQMMPIGVAIPRDADEVSAAVQIASAHNVPILPRGGGSSLAGQAVGHALILDFSRYMDDILEVDAASSWVRVQPGITLGNLNLSLRERELMFGPDPASADRATMGGILGNNSTGAHSIVYGMTLDHVIETEVVLADGSRVKFDSTTSWEGRARRATLEGELYRKLPDILQEYRGEIKSRYPRTFRHVAGYNLNRMLDPSVINLSSLMVGSEGTLGVVTEMKVNLVPVPRAKRLVMVHYADMRMAMEAVPLILESHPTAIEVLDKMLLDLTRDRIEYSRLLTFVRGNPQVVLLVEFSGERENEVADKVRRFQDRLKSQHHREPIVDVSDPQEQANVWFVRKVGLGILMSIRGDAKPIPFIEDAAVPVEHLADYVTQIYEFSKEVGVDQVAMYAHASAGCIHIRPLVNLKTVTGVRQLRQIAEKSVELVVSYGGTTSGEHGEGLARGEFSERLFGAELVRAFEEVKDLFDPQGLLNPGKVVRTPKIDDESLLRFGSDYALAHTVTNPMMDFQDDGGFAGAVEMCNGAGVCRKLEEGVMCPSFQATRDETHSTRGRANALRAAMMGQLGPDGMQSEELFEVLDLCLSCHACKAECPSAVDMAKLKAEFLYHYYQHHRMPLRSRIFANIASINRVLQPVALLANPLMKFPGKWILNRLGVHPDRQLPDLAPQTFSRWYASWNGHMSVQSSDPSRQVVFFHDTFIEHHDPHIGIAVVKVLKAGGYEVIVLQDRVCCGRPAVSKGLLNQAEQAARHNIQLLAPYARQGIPIVGCEPSCMAMLVDEYPSLYPGEDAEVVAAASTMIDVFLAREIETGNLLLETWEDPAQILFHGHCQQKATFGTESTMQLLNAIPGYRTEMIDSGCCGMAGSFGYEEEHYDLSIQLAEMALAPIIREAPDDVVICASGTSCRQQIYHTTGKMPLHPIEIVAAALR